MRGLTLEAGPVGAGVARFAVPAVAHVALGAAAASGALGCVPALGAREAGRRVALAGDPDGRGLAAYGAKFEICGELNFMPSDSLLLHNFVCSRCVFLV